MSQKKKKLSVNFGDLLAFLHMGKPPSCHPYLFQSSWCCGHFYGYGKLWQRHRQPGMEQWWQWWQLELCWLGRRQQRQRSKQPHTHTDPKHPRANTATYLWLPTQRIDPRHLLIFSLFSRSNWALFWTFGGLFRGTSSPRQRCPTTNTRAFFRMETKQTLKPDWSIFGCLEEGQEPAICECWSHRHQHNSCTQYKMNTHIYKLYYLRLFSMTEHWTWPIFSYAYPGSSP